MDFGSYLSIVQPPDVGPVATLILLGTSLVGAVIMAMTSIGGGLVMAVMAQVLSPLALIPIHGVTQLGSSLSRVAVLWPHIQWKTVPGFAIGACIGATAGAFLFVQISPSILQLIIGGFILSTVFVRIPPLNARHLFATGVFASFLSMFVGAMATFLSGVLKGLNLPPAGHVSTHAVMNSFMHTAKIVLFGALGFTYAPYVPFLIAMVVCSIVGTWIGKQFLMSPAGAKYFRPILNAILIVLSLKLMWTGIEGILAEHAA